jgi:hypothetical protein
MWFEWSRGREREGPLVLFLGMVGMEDLLPFPFSEVRERWLGRCLDGKSKEDLVFCVPTRCQRVALRKDWALLRS